jgi:hypothetical protein
MNRAPEPILRLRDNPILIAMGRRRLRRRHLLPAMMIVGLLCVCTVLFAFTREGKDNTWKGAVYALLVGIGGLLFLRGTVHIAGQLTDERRSGILDFHRATPTTPWTDAAGYLLGTPAREYALCAVILPFLLAAGLLAGMSPLGLLGSVLGMVLAGWLYHAIGLLAGLSVSNRRGTTVLAVAFVVMLLSYGPTLARSGLVTLAYLSPHPLLARLILEGPNESHPIGVSVAFYGLTLHPVIFTLLVQGSLLGFLLSGAARKLRREGAPAFSRPGAAAFFGLMVFLVFGGAWGVITGAEEGVAKRVESGDLVAAYLVAGGILGTALILTLVPSYLEFVRGLRRARRRGQAEAPWLEDAAGGLPLLGLFGGLLLAGLLALLLAMRGRISSVPLMQELMLCVATVLAFLGFVAGAAEFTRICLRGGAYSGGALITFLSMALPWMLGGILSKADKQVTQFIYALSPAYGVIGSAASLAQAWAGRGNGDAPLPALLTSLLITGVAAGWFFLA